MPTYPVDDLTLTDYDDPTKTFQFDASLITTGGRRRYTVPDVDGTIPLVETFIADSHIWTGSQRFDVSLRIRDYLSGFEGIISAPVAGFSDYRDIYLQDVSGTLALLSDIPDVSTFLDTAEADALYAALSHSHSATAITTGTLAVARGGTGIAALGSGIATFLGATKPTTIAGYGITDLDSLGDARWGKLGANNTWTGIQTIDTTIGGSAIEILGAASTTLLTWINSDLSGNDILISAPGSIAAPVYLVFPSTGTSLVSDASVVTLANKTFQTFTMASGANIALNTGTGTKIGTATGQKLGFHNATAVIQRAGAAQAAVATTAATQTTPWGFSTAAQADAIVVLLNEIRAMLTEKGLMKGSA